MFYRVIKLVCSVVLISMLGMGAVYAQIANTGHNMTNAVMSDFNDNCRFCHTPHSSLVTYPLWTRLAGTTAAGDFTMYTSGTMDPKNIGVTPGEQSMACLSCHDGATAFDNVTGRTITANNTMSDKYGGTLAIFGTDLTNDHPIGVDVGVAEMNAAATIATTLPLYANGTSDALVECASCHDPHTDQFAFLRVTDDLCVTCHIK